MTYYEICNVYLEHISVIDLTNTLEQSGDNYYFILHDKDTMIAQSNGEILTKKPHYHIIVGTNENSRTAKKTLSLMFQNISEKVIINNVRNLQKFMRYLRHQDNKEKFQYPLEAVITNDQEGYEEITAQFIKPMTECDITLEEYFQWCLSIENKPTYLDVLHWWRKKNSLSYFVQHQKQLLDMSEKLFECPIECTEQIQEYDFLKEIN